MSKNLYRNFVKLLEIWPVNEAKKGRDLSEIIRSDFRKNFPRGETSTVSNPIECNENYESLNRIARNMHAKRYPRILESTAMGLSPEISGKAVSNDFLQYMRDN